MLVLKAGCLLCYSIGISLDIENVRDLWRVGIANGNYCYRLNFTIGKQSEIKRHLKISKVISFGYEMF